MTKKQRAAEAVRLLKERYPDALCSLDYSEPFQLLVSVRLAAQCTDARVNLVTPALFERFKTVKDFAAASPEEVEPYIRSCGFFRAKARDIVGAAKAITERFSGEIPRDIDTLLTLPGVGRKTAKLVCGDLYNMPGAVVADTHCIRISNRRGLGNSKDPHKVELQLRPLLPPDESNDFCHRLVLFGRDICDARKPLCGECPLANICVSAPKTAEKT